METLLLLEQPFEEEAPSQDVDSTFFAKAFDPGRHVLVCDCFCGYRLA